MSDSIDRQKVLATLDFADKALNGSPTLTGEERTVETYKELLTECIKVLPSVENKGEWIPVTERLPKDHEEVLIYLSTNRITIGLYNSHILPIRPYKPIGWGVKAQTAVHNFCSDDVIAWQPLPEPYKEKE